MAVFIPHPFLWSRLLIESHSPLQSSAVSRWLVEHILVRLHERAFENLLHRVSMFRIHLQKTHHEILRLH